jgi:hypothetical protein
MGGARIGIGVIAILLGVPALALAQPCRGYPESVRPDVRPRVEALRLIEREAADRLVGLDTRTYPYLAGEARKAAGLIGHAAGLALEEGTQRCRNAVPPVRSICQNAAQMLATVLDEQEAGAAAKASKEAYAGAMASCERLMDLRPLNTAVRTTD